MASSELETAPADFLWEQIAASVDAVELHEVRRVVGGDLVQACADMYAEVRALRDILQDFSQATDQLVEETSTQSETMRASHAGLVALEVKQLVAHLLAAGSSADSILPKGGRKQRLALESLLGEASGLPRRPRTAQAAGSRSSLREIREMGGRQEGFDRLTLDGSDARRPHTTTGTEHTHHHAARLEYGEPGAGGIRPLSASSAGSRPSTARPPTGSTGATGVGASRPATASSVASGDSSLAAEALHTGDRGSVVVVALRSALEEERLALLAQTEQVSLYTHMHTYMYIYVYVCTGGAFAQHSIHGGEGVCDC